MKRGAQLRFRYRRARRRGRPPGRTPAQPHRERARFVRRSVFHVRLRVRPDVPSLRRLRMARRLRHSLSRCCSKPGFRVCQFSIQTNHVHLVVEADHHEALARGMQGLAISLAKRINHRLGRRGSVFRERYRADAVRSANQMRNTLCYVLHNARRHGARLVGADTYSSARFFDGWSRRTGLPPPDEEAGAAPVARARTPLLAKRWRWIGLIDPDETPTARR